MKRPSYGWIGAVVIAAMFGMGTTAIASHGPQAPTQNDGWQVENADAALDMHGDEYEALPSPDGTFLILMTGDGLYRSDEVPGAWQPRVRRPGAIHVNVGEIGELLSPSGHSLLLARDVRGATSQEFFVWQLQGSEDWPAACPRPVAGAAQRARHDG